MKPHDATRRKRYGRREHELRQRDLGTAYRLTAPKPTDRLACRAGACDPSEVANVSKQLHDALIVANPIRSGPVRWVIYDTGDLAEVEKILRTARFHPQSDLLAWIAAHRGVQLVLAWVPVPLPYALVES